MSITSPLASLYTVLQAVRTSAELNAPLLRKNEAATRTVLIDPILRVLGWDTANVLMVEPEKTINSSWRADYALHNSEGKISCLIEAKCLNSDLQHKSVVQQVLGYAFGFGITKIVLTDGMKWHFYDDFKPGDTPLTAGFDIKKDTLATCALLLLTWLDAAHSGHGINIPISSAPKAAFASPSIAHIPEQPKPQKEATDQTAFIGLTHLTTLPALPEQKPRQLRLPDGSVLAIKTWKDILIKTSLYVLQHQPAVTIPYPDKAGKKKFLFGWEKPAAGIGYKETTLYGRPLFIYTNYSAPDCVANTLHALKLLSGKETEAVAVAF
ncbi:hypothetical protein [Hymenobacter sp. APR13]|uniref:hypothetical protein n=1 Tax=Hymenobacter sp. APR13 TaxID=1356852 RepID=UPI0004E04203|nr:hypothetical protein [Hymenobacter sp. APR13]AII52447.1 hypothetical protein N008_10725 [Hymenobacter sp. APR13]